LLEEAATSGEVAAGAVRHVFLLSGAISKIYVGGADWTQLRVARLMNFLWISNESFMRTIRLFYPIADVLYTLAGV
jgi:hypothetical protein